MSEEYKVNPWDIVDEERAKVKQLEAYLEAAQKEIIEWENREASCCPEDVPFEDVIKKLRADLEAAKAENAILNRMVASMALFMRGDGLAENVISEYHDEAEKDLVNQKAIRDEMAGIFSDELRRLLK